MEDSDSMAVKKSEQVSAIKYSEKDMNTRLHTMYIILLSYVHTNSHKTIEYIRILFYGHHFGRHLRFKATEYAYVLYHGLFPTPRLIKK